MISRIDQIDRILAKLDTRLYGFIYWHMYRYVPLQMNDQAKRMFGSDPDNKDWQEILVKNRRYKELDCLEDTLLAERKKYVAWQQIKAWPRIHG